jgi:hypothetical protein
MARKAQKFFALKTAEKAILLKAWFLLGYTRAAILTLSFKRLAASLEHHRDLVKPAAVTLQQVHQAIRLGYLVSAAAHYTPWQSLCLTQVLVTQRLLAKRGIPGQFYLGVRRGCELTDDPTGLSAHAWLQCGDQIVNGAAGHERFTKVSTFSWGRPEYEAAHD